MSSISLQKGLRPCHLQRHCTSCCLLPAEDPHEEQLDQIRVHEQELCSSVPLGSGNCVGGPPTDGWVI
jgi:hypothetical protein